MSMLTLILFFAMQVATPGEMACGGAILDFSMPADLYVAGSADEGAVLSITQGQILYLNGPRIPFLKTGDVNKVVRRMNRVRNPLTGQISGVYYKDLGSIRIEAVDKNHAVARALFSCEAFAKGDLVFPNTPKALVYFSGALSNPSAPIPESGVVGPILQGMSNNRILSAGQLCFFGRGWRDGVKAGDRFTVFRADAAPDKIDSGATEEASGVLRQKRRLPPRILGDIVIIDAGDTTSTAKIINSLSEIFPGDLAIKR